MFVWRSCSYGEKNFATRVKLPLKTHIVQSGPKEKQFLGCNGRQLRAKAHKCLVEPDWKHLMI
jgi:hypothetical protein